jgi:hypothetical protein
MRHCGLCGRMGVLQFKGAPPRLDRLSIEWICSNVDACAKRIYEALLSQ